MLEQLIIGQMAAGRERTDSAVLEVFLLEGCGKQCGKHLLLQHLCALLVFLYVRKRSTKRKQELIRKS
jgi:hypothetical protein